MKLTQEANKEIMGQMRWHTREGHDAPRSLSSMINFILCDFHDEARESGHDLEITILRAAQNILADMTVEEPLTATAALVEAKNKQLVEAEADAGSYEQYQHIKAGSGS